MISYTAQVLAARRALATQQGSPLVADPLAHLFTTEKLLRFAEETDAPVHVVLLRARLLEDLLLRPPYPVEQIVLLGAGFDTKRQRLTFLPETRYLEVDDPDMVARKQQILTEQRLPLPEALPLRLTSIKDVETVLRQTSPELPTLLLAEGFFMYQSESFLRDALAAMVGYYRKKPVLGFDVLAPDQSPAEITAMGARIHSAGEGAWSYVAPAHLEATLRSLGMRADLWSPDRLATTYLGRDYPGTTPLYVCCAFARGLTWAP
ncbi:class I SAM-dependent methyltransferase [Chondromyces apiculatus]|uniref:S-adenosyl-L-methionine-dependent methyltransferase n=1 Tax=Chondromyces apiculatus DSM 436 TaxID=1192034 RepID=A0A017T944_9BACT|nr:class I SAM-dependent methyltransferase [Chondromyces apiculatus]EYF05793.1 Hypothetical protein CAP_2794 [Chondromyces apiculatus DSM 436]